MAKFVERAAIPFLVGCALLCWLWQDRDQSKKIDRIEQKIDAVQSHNRSLESLIRERMENPELWEKLKNQIQNRQDLNYPSN